MSESKQPVMYTDWRDLWHKEAKQLGWMVADNFNGRSVVIDRPLWKQLDKLQRIRNRLDLEWQVKDQTWETAMLAAISAYKLS